MTKAIAGKLFAWVKESGPTANGDAYSQERIDELDDFLFRPEHTPCPVSLTPEELAHLEANHAAVEAALALMYRQD